MVKHWVDELAERLYEELVKREKNVYVLNGGLSVRGVQHIGRLRGEIILNDVLKRILRERGLNVKQFLTIYTQDEWSGKETQLQQFSSPEEGLRYIGYPLINVPDPRGCHRNWVEHFWSDFGEYVKKYFTDGDIEFVTTTELYGGRLRDFVHKAVELRSKIRGILNKYRGEAKIPEDWIPFNPICGGCGRINTTKSIGYREGVFDYVCEYCGYRGLADSSNGKLGWAIEWVGVWWSLNVDFEPYGKDHATPGGSRDRCNELAKGVFGFEPPLGAAYEWVSLKIGGVEKDMTSSGFVGLTPKDWVEIAHPHVLRFLMLKTPLSKKITVDPVEVPRYYDQFFRAERIYYGLEKAVTEEEEVILRRSYELSYPIGKPPETPPEQVPYTHVAILTQILPKGVWFTEGIRRLKISGHLSEEPSEHGLNRVFEMIEKAHVWVQRYAPVEMRISIPEKPDPKVIKDIPERYREILIRMKEELMRLQEWSEENIKNILVKATANIDDESRRKTYEFFYLLFTGKTYGPRAAPLLALLGKERTIEFLNVLPGSV